MSNTTNASVGPWWFTAIVAGITGAMALLAAGLTTVLSNRQANKRLKIELKHQGERFTQELEHKSEIERKHLIHNARTEMYEEISSVTGRILFSVSESSVQGLLASDPEAVLEARKLRFDQAVALQELTYKAVLCSSNDVGLALTGFADPIILIAKKLELHRIELLGGRKSVLNLDNENAMVSSRFHELMGRMRKDLGTVEEVSKELTDMLKKAV